MDPRAKLLYDHWSTVCGHSRAPFRQDMNPAQFRDILDSVFILDWVSTRDVSFRLAGSRICDSFGMELRGLNIFSLWQGEDRARIRQLVHRVVTEPCIGHAVGVQKNECGRSADFEILLLPLKQGDGSPKQIIGCNILTKEHSDGKMFLPSSSQWIDGITVYKVPMIESFQPFQFPVAHDGHPAKKQCNDSFPKATNSFGRGKINHPFRVIEGGLARE